MKQNLIVTASHRSLPSHGQAFSDYLLSIAREHFDSEIHQHGRSDAQHACRKMNCLPDASRLFGFIEPTPQSESE